MGLHTLKTRRRHDILCFLRGKSGDRIITEPLLRADIYNLVDFCSYMQEREDVVGNWFLFLHHCSHGCIHCHPPDMTLVSGMCDREIRKCFLCCDDDVDDADGKDDSFRERMAKKATGA